MDFKIAYYGNPILRKKAKPVKEFNEELKELAQAMIDYVAKEENSIGLSGPQIHKLVRIFVAQPPDYDEETGEWIDGEIRVFINPKIIKKSSEIWDFEEGCISIPKVYGKVTRHWTISVEYQDLEGAFHTEEFKGYPARVFQHEFDHLNGVLHVDRIAGKARQQIEPMLKKIKEQYNPK